MNKNLLSTIEVAKLLNISRVAVFKKIKSGEIKAKKVGHRFVIEKEELPMILGSVLREEKKRDIEKSVEKTFKEYGRALQLLGKE